LKGKLPLIHRLVSLTAGLILLLVSAASFAQGIHVTLRSHVDPYDGFETYSGVWGDGNFAYLGSERRNGVLIYDITNPDAPVLAFYYGSTGPIDMEDIKVANGIGYFASNMGGGLHIVDVTNPYSPTLISQITSANGGYDNTHKVAVWQNFVFIPQNLTPPAIIKVFDVTNPTSPVLFTTITAQDSKWVNDLSIQTTTSGSTRMYTAGWGGLGEIYDITNLATTGAVFLGSFNDGIDGSSVSATDDGNFLAYSRKTTDGTSEVKIWNITNPASPVLASTLTMSALGIDAVAPHDPHIMGNLLYVSWFQAGTLIFDITNPSSPVFVGAYDTWPDAISPGQLQGNWGVYPYLGQDRVLISDRNTGLYIVNATGVSSSPALYNLHVNPSTVLAGSLSAGTVYLVGVAGAGGIVVSTSSDNAAAQTPASVTVPQNGTTAAFAITTSLLNSSTNATISASYSGTTDNASLNITPVADYSLAVGPSSLTLFPNQTGTFSGTATAFAGYSSVVSLSCAGTAPPNCSYFPTSVTPTASGVPFTLDVSSSTVANYSFNVQGIGGDSNHTTQQVPVTVNVVDFTLGTPSPAALTVFPVSNSQFTVQVAAVGSFNSAVDLSCNAPAAGITCSFVPSASVNPTASTPVTVTVTVSTTSNTPAGQYTLTISANSAGAPAAKTSDVSLSVVDFVLGAASPGTLNVPPGTSSQASLQVSALGPFAGTVSLSCNAPATGVTCTFAPSATVNPTASTPVNVTVTVATAAATSPGQYTLVVSGNSTGAPAAKMQSVALNVIDFSLSAATGSQTITAGATANYSLTVAPLPVSGSFPNLISFACSGLPTRSTCAFSPNTLTPGGNTSNVMLSIGTSTAAASLRADSRTPAGPMYALWLPLASVFVLGSVSSIPRKRKASRGIAMLALLTLWFVVGCGGGGTSSPPPQPGTPPGTYSIMVTATAGSLSHTATVGLTVQ